MERFVIIKFLDDFEFCGQLEIGLILIESLAIGNCKGVYVSASSEPDGNVVHHIGCEIVFEPFIYDDKLQRQRIVSDILATVAIRLHQHYNK